jgi:hypothetical protein
VLMEHNLGAWGVLVACVLLASIQVVGSQALPIEQMMEQLGMVSEEECRRLYLLCQDHQFELSKILILLVELVDLRVSDLSVDFSSLGTNVAASAFSDLRMGSASFLVLFLFLLRRPMLRIVE